MSRKFRFGLFVLDAERGELLRKGALVRLQAQPTQVWHTLYKQGAVGIGGRTAIRGIEWQRQIKGRTRMEAVSEETCRSSQGLLLVSQNQGAASS